MKRLNRPPKLQIKKSFSTSQNGQRQILTGHDTERKQNRFRLMQQKECFLCERDWAKKDGDGKGLAGERNRI